MLPATIKSVTIVAMNTFLPMHIGLIIYGSLNTLTGGYIYDRMVVDYLRECGHHVEIISQPPGPYWRHMLSSISPGFYSDIVNSSYDLLLQDELNHPSLLRLNRRLRKRADFPIVAVVHQVLCRQPRNGFLNHIYELIETGYLNSVDAFIFNSNTTRRTVENLIACHRPSIVAYPAGDRLGCLASADRIKLRALTPGPLRLIFVGNVLPNKGLRPLIQRLAQLPSETWQLTVVGSLTMDRRYVHRIKKLIVTQNIERQVALLGPIDGAELASLLARSHVFSMPYSHEGFGMAHLEAMAYALPVIGSKSGALKEFVIPGRNGFLVDPDDAETLLTCLQRLNHDRQLLIDMSQAALQTFRRRPPWRHTVQAVHAFLKGLM
jgi:glycosyltransferase involved in cell wall biosynthesis